MSISNTDKAEDTASPPDTGYATSQRDAGATIPFASAADDGLDEEGLPVRRSPADADSSRQDDDMDADEDANEEVQDYGGFAALVGGAKGVKVSSKSTAAGAGTTPAPQRKSQISSQLIRKGEKDFEEHGTRAQRDALEQSRAVMESVLAHTRVHGSSGPSAASGSATDAIRGWYFPDAWADEADEPPLDTAGGGAAAVERNSDTAVRRFAHTRHRVVMVEAVRGTMFASVGAVPGRPAWIEGLPKGEQPRPKPGFDRVWLLPEEALFLVERGSMELWYPLQPLEAVLAMLARVPTPSTVGRDADEQDIGLPLSLQAAYSLLIGPDADTASGDSSNSSNSSNSEPSHGRIPLPSYQVYTHLRRSGYQVLRAVHTDPQTPLDAAAVSPAAAQTAPVTNIWQWLYSLVGRGRSAPGDRRSEAPLLRPGIYRSYDPIYAQLRLARPPAPPAATSAASAASAASAHPSPFRIVFHVWKAGKKGSVPFSKARPPPPDFYMAVVDAHTTGVPTLDQITTLLASVPPLPPPAVPPRPQAAATSATSATSFPPLPVVYRRLKLGRRCVIVSVVDHGIVNYMRFADGTFGAEPLYPRFDAVASGTFAGRGGGGKHGKGGKGSKGGRGAGGAGGKTAAPKNKYS